MSGGDFNVYTEPFEKTKLLEISCVPDPTFKREYWQLAMTRQNWNTQMSLKQPWFSKMNPRKDTRNARNTATTFSDTS